MTPHGRGPRADLLADLTDAQREAVTHFEGPLLILAGAGSGKTRVITRRVAWLLDQGVRPSSILAITFTNKAAGEMRQRVEALVPNSRVWVSTFHSLGARLLRQYSERFNVGRNFTIYDQNDRTKLVKDALEAAGIDNVKFSPDRIGGAISKAKNQLQTPEQYEKKAYDFFSQTTARVYYQYEKRLREANALDFDDLLLWPALALRHDEDLRSELDARFRFVLIDEYQDTNTAQYEIARRLSVDNPNVCVVGDPDQCLPPGTRVETPTGPRPIEAIGDGDEVIAAAGWGRLAPTRVDKVMVNQYRGKLIRVRVEGGIEFRATPNHRCFARLSAAQRLHLRQFRSSNGHRWQRMKWRLTPNYSILSATQVAATDPIDRSYRDKLLTVEELSEGPRFRLLKRNWLFACVPAEDLAPGMMVPVNNGGNVIERSILNVEEEDYAGLVYDLSVPTVHNFVANGVVVHNSIYKWRGSDIRNILDFERDFPDARVITLDRNYRSTKSILAAADALIAHNKQRKPKTLVTDNPQGPPVRVLTFDTGLDEAEMVVKRIKDARRTTGRPYRDVAVFIRINALSRALEAAFVKHGVPFQIVKGLAFFERKENRDVLAYLRLLANPQDDLSFLRIVNEPARGIGDVSLKHLRNYAAPRELNLLAACADVSKIPEIRGKAATGLRDFYRMMTGLREHLEEPPDEVIRLVLDRSGYRAMLQGSSDTEDQERLANIEELITAAKQFAAEDSSRTLGDFLEQITLASDVDGWDEKQDCVSVMTLHAAKGLEFPVVYVLAVEQGLLPHERSLAKDEDVEEERRLCFVGMTRAKEELSLCHARLREFRGQALYAVPSMFLEELPKEGVEALDLSHHSGGPAASDLWRTGSPAAVEGWRMTGVAPRGGSRPETPPDPDGLAVGRIVHHTQYGHGQVTDLSGYGALRRVKVRFQRHGEKTFIADKVRLTIVHDD